MRDIKFRLWNPDRKVITAGLELNTLLLTTDAGFVREFNKCHMIWMQYTGLKDKNGTEIYEGDVIVVADKRCYIRYYAARASFGIYFPIHNTILPFWECVDDSIELKILGNIYENPELIQLNH